VLSQDDRPHSASSTFFYSAFAIVTHIPRIDFDGAAYLFNTAVVNAAFLDASKLVNEISRQLILRLSNTIYRDQLFPSATGTAAQLQQEIARC
jgi:hypothetical protein